MQLNGGVKHMDFALEKLYVIYNDNIIENESKT